MSIESIKHQHEKRAHIPSKEEAGFEETNPKVQEKNKAEYPLNPIVHRGQDPELFWLNKYGRDDREELLQVDIRSLYRHEHISPEVLMQKFYQLKEEKSRQESLFDVNELFGNALKMDEIDKISEYYQHQDGWSNRLIQGDSLLVMTSLLEREGMAGKVQMIYMDPPYGIKYNSNWQMKLNSRIVKDGSDDHLTGEPEQVKAFRDTWELGIHSYLSYLRDRLLVAKELLTESGSCFVQISDENVHLVRSVMDEVFGSENFVSIIAYASTSGFESSTISRAGDYLIWYAKDKESLKYRPLYQLKKFGGDGSSAYKKIELKDGTRISIADWEKKYKRGFEYDNRPKGCRLFAVGDLTSQDPPKEPQPFEFEGQIYEPKPGNHWKANYPDGMECLKKLKRIEGTINSIGYVRYFDDFPYMQINNLWTDTLGQGQYGADGKLFTVQTAISVAQRCLLMTTDPSDLVIDPTCGSGTTAYVAEQWGRRWITIDTSRIALNIAKTRLMTAILPYYKLYDEEGRDVRQGFIYKKVPHITLKSLANDEPPEEETLYDQPEQDRKKLRVAGPFTVETLQSFEPVSPESLDENLAGPGDLEGFEERIFEHLKSAGIKNGIRNEHAVFIRVERLSSAYLHAEGFWNSAEGEKKAYLHIGPKFGTVSKRAVNEAIKECRTRGDADWLVILGFSFESDISNQSVTTSMGSFEVTRTRMHDDLLQEGLLKRDKKAASFVTIGEPDIKLHRDSIASGDGISTVQVEVCGLDIYDPIKDEVKARNVADIAYWMVDDDYDGSNFVVKQVFFCGGNKDEFKKWQKGLENLARTSTKRLAEKTLRIEIDEEAFDRIYNHKSHPIEIKKKGQKIAVRVISQFGEESTKVLSISDET